MADIEQACLFPRPLVAVHVREVLVLQRHLEARKGHHLRAAGHMKVVQLRAFQRRWINGRGRSISETSRTDERPAGASGNYRTTCGGAHTAAGGRLQQSAAPRRTRAIGGCRGELPQIRQRSCAPVDSSHCSGNDSSSETNSELLTEKKNNG